MILAGDVGGTKVLLRLGDGGGVLAEERYPSRDFGSLTEIVRAFLDAAGRGRPDRAAFGIAGPIDDNRCRATNLPWDVDGNRMGHDLGIARVRLLNDFEAVGRGLEVLDPDDIAVLNPPEPDPRGRIAILGAGTGLGEGFMVPCGGHEYAFVPSEGGHTDFAPRNDKEMGFLRFMLRVHRRVSIERAVSGPGIANLFHYLVDAGGKPAESVSREIAGGADIAAVVAGHAADRSCLVCVEAMDMFWNLYGAEAGNLALKVLPAGGIFLAGGIVAKNLAALRSGPFMAAYGFKGRMSDLVREFPVRAILNQKVGLLGAALVAERL